LKDIRESFTTVWTPVSDTVSATELYSIRGPKFAYLLE